MKILKLLNKKIFFNYYLFYFAASILNAEEKPVDIWNIDKEN